MFVLIVDCMCLALAVLMDVVEVIGGRSRWRTRRGGGGSFLHCPIYCKCQLEHQLWEMSWYCCQPRSFFCGDCCNNHNTCSALDSNARTYGRTSAGIWLRTARFWVDGGRPSNGGESLSVAVPKKRKGKKDKGKGKLKGERVISD